MTGWSVYVFGDLIGAVIEMALVAVVRGMPDKAERTAAGRRNDEPVAGSHFR